LPPLDPDPHCFCCPDPDLDSGRQKCPTKKGKVKKCIVFYFWMFSLVGCRRLLHSVGDPGCLSRILILSILDPESNNSDKREGGKNLLFCSQKYHSNGIENYFIFEQVKKRIGANLQQIIVRFIQIIALKSMGFGSRIRDPGIFGHQIPGSGPEFALI
jgi:hypothetical protein